MTHPLGGKTSLAVGVMLALLAIPYTTERLARFRVARSPWDKTDRGEAQTLQAANVAAVPTEGRRGHRS